MSVTELIESTLDPDSWESWDDPPVYGPIDEDYAESLERARAKSGVDEAVVTGLARVAGIPVAVIASEFSFLGGSIGAATSRRIITAIHRATAAKLPLLISPASGGTRMQEGTPAFALMISITAAIHRHKDQHLPYLVYLRNPTTGGAMASWGAAGHFTFAEPGATLGFLGPRVVELTTGTPLSDGVQSAEHLADNGVIDGVVDPVGLRSELTRVLSVLMPTGTPPAYAPTTADDGPSLLRAPAPDSANALATARSAWDCITATRSSERLGIEGVLEHLGKDWVPLSGTGEGQYSKAVAVGLAKLGPQPVVLVGMSRTNQPPSGSWELGGEAMLFARRGFRLAHELGIPLVTVIDTPGGELSDRAETSGIARTIAQTLAEILDIDVPTVSLIMGQGCGGAALAFVPADCAVACEDAWLAPLPPEGASAILYRDVDHAAELMEKQSVAAPKLYCSGVIDYLMPALSGEDHNLGDQAGLIVDGLIEAVQIALREKVAHSEFADQSSNDASNSGSGEATSSQSVAGTVVPGQRRSSRLARYEKLAFIQGDSSPAE